MPIQSILFDRNFWTLRQAMHYLRDRDYRYDKVDMKDEYYRFRQVEPIGFTYYFTKSIPGYFGSVKYVIAA